MKTGQDYYSTTKVKMPEPELYVICTGKQKRKPKYITLSKEFFGGKEIAVDAKIRMIYDSKFNLSAEDVKNEVRLYWKKASRAH